MQQAKILIIGAGIGGLTAAIALRQKGFEVDIFERDPTWSVYGVGIIQQSNVVRAMADLGLIDDYLHAGFGFDHLSIFIPTGVRVARVASPKLVEGYPANVGIGRKALHKVLGDRALGAGAVIRLGVTAAQLDDDGQGVVATLSDGSSDRYDLVIGADGLYSATRNMIRPDAQQPMFTGQSVWRYNFNRPEDLTDLCVYDGPIGVGLVPLSDALMYMYVTTPEPGNPRYPKDGLATAMRAKLKGLSPQIEALAKDISDDEAVVYKPLESLFLEGPWHKGRIVLLGDAVHASTPHLGQGAGMAIEDAIVLAEEIAAATTPEAAFSLYQARREDRCRYIVKASLAICQGQLGLTPPLEQAKATHDMFEIVAKPI